MLSSFLRAITPTRSVIKKKKKKNASSTLIVGSINRNDIDIDNDTKASSMTSRSRSDAVSRRMRANIHSDSSDDEEENNNGGGIGYGITSTGQRKVAAPSRSDDVASSTTAKDEDDNESPTDYANEPLQSDSEVEDVDDAEKSKVQRPWSESNLKTMTHHELWKCLDTELRVNIGTSVACGICRSTVTEPTRTPCLHVYCRECIHLAIRYSKNSWCPNCKTPITRRGLQPVPTYFQELAVTYKKMLVEFGFAPGKHTADFTLTQLAPGKTVDNEDVEKCLDRLNVSRTWQLNALPMEKKASTMQILENRKAVKANQEAYEAAARKRDASIEAAASGDDGNDDALSFATPAETEPQREQLSFVASNETMEQERHPVHLPKVPKKSAMANVLHRSKKKKKRNSPTFAELPKFENFAGGRVAVVASSKQPPPQSSLVAAPAAKGSVGDVEDGENTTPKASGRRSSIYKTPAQVETAEPFEAEMSPIVQQSSQPTILETPRENTEKGDDDSQQSKKKFLVGDDDEDEEEEAKEDAVYSPVEDVTGLCEDTMGALHWYNDDNPLSQGLYKGTQDEESEDDEDYEKNRSRSLLAYSPTEISSNRSRSLPDVSSDRSKSILRSSLDRSKSLLDGSPGRSGLHDRDGEEEPQEPREEGKETAEPLLPSTETNKSDPTSSTMVNNTSPGQKPEEVALQTNVDDEGDEKPASRLAISEANDSPENSNSSDYDKGLENNCGSNEESNSLLLEAAAAAADYDDDDMTQPILTQDSPDSKMGAKTVGKMPSSRNANESPNVNVPDTIDETGAEEAEEYAEPSASVQNVTGRSSRRRQHRSKSREKKSHDEASSNKARTNDEETAADNAARSEKSSECEASRTATTRRGRSRSSSRTNITLLAKPSTGIDNSSDRAPTNVDSMVSPTKKTETEISLEAGEPRRRRSRSSSRTRKSTSSKLSNVDDGNENFPSEEGIEFQAVVPEAERKPISKRKPSGKTYSRRGRRSFYSMNDEEEEGTKSALNIGSESLSDPIASKISLERSNHTKNQETVAANDGEDGNAGSISEQVQLTPKENPGKVSAERDTKADAAKPENDTKKAASDESDKKPAARKKCSKKSSLRHGRSTTSLEDGAAENAPTTLMSEAAEEPPSESSATATVMQRQSLSTSEKEANTTSMENNTAPGFSEGDIVKVQARTWPGVNKRGGVAKILEINDDKTYNVGYVLGGKEKNVDGQFLSFNEGPSKRKRTEDSLPLDLLKELACQGFDTSEAGVQVPAKVRKSLREASAASSENTKPSKKQQSNSKRARKTEPASKTLQDKTNRKREKSAGTQKAKKKKARTASTRSDEIDVSVNTESNSIPRTAKQKATGAQTKPTKATGDTHINSKIAEVSNDEAQNLADTRYRDLFQAAVESGVLEVLVTSDLSEDAKRHVSSFSKMGGTFLFFLRSFDVKSEYTNPSPDALIYSETENRQKYQ